MYRQTDRSTHQIDIYTDRHICRRTLWETDILNRFIQMDIQTWRQKQTDIQAVIKTYIYIYIYIERKTVWQTDRHRQTDRQETDRSRQHNKNTNRVRLGLTFKEGNYAKDATLSWMSKAISEILYKIRTCSFFSVINWQINSHFTRQLSSMLWASAWKMIQFVVCFLVMFTISELFFSPLRIVRDALVIRVWFSHDELSSTSVSHDSALSRRRTKP